MLDMKRLQCVNNYLLRVGRSYLPLKLDKRSFVFKTVQFSTGAKFQQLNNSNELCSYEINFHKSITQPEEFWAEAAETLVWNKKWNKVLDDSKRPFTKWFVGGELNVSFNCLDRHVENGLGHKIALIHDSPVTNKITKISYLELMEKVSKFASVLAQLGVSKGDIVLIYMPMIPEAVIAMLASIRLGAVHSVVFGGFASKELATRIDHAQPKVIVSASHGIEGSRIVEYKPILSKALMMCKHTPHKVVMFQRDRSVPIAFNKDLDVDYDDMMANAAKSDPIPVDSNHPLYLLHTSGTTGKPKAVVRPCGGHAVNLMWSMPNVYGMKKGDTWWAASDLGWVVGHSYICYAPLLYGITSVLFEGKPVGTPNPGTYFRVLDEHKVSGIFVAPTAMRAVRKEDSKGEWAKKYDLSNLRYFYVAGEHCDYETLEWIKKIVKVPVLDNWWQTETGSPMTATCVGMGNSLNPPKDVSGMPVPGWDVKVIDSETGEEANVGELGRIVCKLPLPPGAFSTLYKADERFHKLYFENFEGYYDTMDAGIKTEDNYICVVGREDDVINVAGHRLSTSALEEAIMEHNSVAECAAIGVPDPLKGQIPLGLFIIKDGKSGESDVKEEIIRMVRDSIGPVASFKLIVQVTSLPTTRSGKIARKTIADLARNKQVKIPPTIDDASVYKDIKLALQSLGFALQAPDPI